MYPCEKNTLSIHENRSNKNHSISRLTWNSLFSLINLNTISMAEYLFRNYNTAINSTI